MNTIAMPNPDQELPPIPDWPAQRASSHTGSAPAPRHVDWVALYAALSEPFDPKLIRYRAGATNRDKTQAQALRYVDPRAYEDRLNQLVPGHWEVTFEPWGEQRIICRLTIHGITRSSTGEANDSPDGIAGTSAEAQAFKRACAKFGLGRHLYTISPRWVQFDPSTGRIRQHMTGEVKAEAPSGTSRLMTRDRARRLVATLRGLGISDAGQLKLAADLLARPVTDLTNITESEAGLIWRAARSMARQVQGAPPAQPREPTRPPSVERARRGLHEC